MLKQLYLKNYALFAETRVDFPAGLNILTGETGAGKSLLVGALGLITGKRADNSMIFLSEEKCIVEATFANLPKVIEKQLIDFEEFDLEEILMIRREIRPSGKSRAFVNDTPVSLQTLRQVSSLLLDLHSQHANQSLLSQDHQLALVDAFAGIQGEVSVFGGRLKKLELLAGEIRKLEKQEQEARDQWEYLQYQLQELEAAKLESEEEEKLEQELNLLQHAEEVREALGGASDLLYDQDSSLYNQLNEVLEPLKKVANMTAQIGGEVEQLIAVQQQLKDSSFVFQDLLDTVESDPERIAFVEERLSLYHGLKIKYGVKSGAELVAKWEQLAKTMTGFQSLGERINGMKEALAELKTKLLKQGLKLEAARNKAGKQLSDHITDLLAEVGFKKARFEVAVERNLSDTGSILHDSETIRPLPSGINRVFFVIQTNPGMPSGPLSQIASGGEISRVMLAIKTALADKFSFPVLIFDEIDTGISGEIAHKVGAVMEKLAERFQIISITHLPQIAAKGVRHYQIKKQIQGETTTSTVVPLDQAGRIQILAEMISGDAPTPSALKNAEELILKKSS
ncbi:MAG: DNA repair protein RecN [Bacteroidota bacterium]